MERERKNDRSVARELPVQSGVSGTITSHQSELYYCQESCRFFLGFADLQRLYRIIFGDLRAKAVSTEELAKLESPNTNIALKPNDLWIS